MDQQLFTQTQSQQMTQDSSTFMETVEEQMPWGRLLFTAKFSGLNPIDLIDPEFKTGRDGNDFDFASNVKSEALSEKIKSRISKVHFKIYRDLSQPFNPVYIEDFSRNGTFINKERLERGKRRILLNKDIISIVLCDNRVFIFQDLNISLTQGLPKEVTSKYYIGRELGKGACGIVKLIHDIKSADQFAMKEVTKNKLDAKPNLMNDPDRIMNEVAIIKKLKHPCIIQMHDIIDTSESLYIVLELMRGGDMINRISKSPNKCLPEKLTKFYFYQMCLAIQYLHDQGVTHRDIKPDNILLATDEEETILKITDFGLSKFVQKHSLMKTLCGTPQYVAPEVLTTNGQGAYTKKVDIWSMGCCLYACLSGSVPFTGDNIANIAKQIINGKIYFDRQKWKNISEDAMNVVRSCLKTQVRHRPAIDTLLKNTWLNDEDVINKVQKLLNLKLIPDQNVAENAIINNRCDIESRSVREPPLKRPRFDRVQY